MDYQSSMVKHSKAIAVTAQEMVTILELDVVALIPQSHEDVCAFASQITKSVTCPDELGALASQVTGDYSQLAVQGRLAAHTAEPEEVRMVQPCWEPSTKKCV